MNDELDKIIKEKYDNIKYQKFNLNDIEKIILSDRKKYNFKIKHFYKAACVIFVMIIFSTLLIYYNMENKNDEKNKNNIIANNSIIENSEKYDSNKLPVASKKIEINKPFDISSYATNKVDYVLVVRVDDIVGYTNYSELLKDYTYPVTKIRGTVIKSLKGDISETIEFYKTGGVISMLDYERTLTNEQIEKQGYNNITDEEKKNTYVEIVSTVDLNYAKPEISKHYLVCLRKDNMVYNGLIVTGVYGLREYDENTNSIKAVSSDKWESLEDNKILKEAILN